MSNQLEQFQLIINELKALTSAFQKNNKLLEKLVKGEVKEKDEILTSKLFQEKIKIPGEDPKKTQKRMHNLLSKHPYLRSRVTGLGILINYTEYLKLKK